MDDLGIQTAMLSISTPGVHFEDDKEAGELARKTNLLPLPPPFRTLVLCENGRELSEGCD
jgi:hypothetical protein